MIKAVKKLEIKLTIISVNELSETKSNQIKKQTNKNLVTYHRIHDSEEENDQRSSYLPFP